jgi:hypothetical protein
MPSAIEWDGFLFAVHPFLSLLCMAITRPTAVLVDGYRMALVKINWSMVRITPVVQGGAARQASPGLA